MKHILILLLGISLSACTASSQPAAPVHAGSEARMNLATPDDLPPGTLGKPGKESGISLGLYNTCKAYADYFLSQNWWLPIANSIINPVEPVVCKKAHTCNCYKNVYFESEAGDHPFYRCVEDHSEQVENIETYTSTYNEKLNGVIKFAKPKSLCKLEN